jgi:hypothetical protein
MPDHVPTIAGLLDELGKVLHDTRTREERKLPWVVIERELARDGGPPMKAARRTCWLAEGGNHVRDVDRIVHAYARAAGVEVSTLLSDATQAWARRAPTFRDALLLELE